MKESLMAVHRQVKLVIEEFQYLILQNLLMLVKQIVYHHRHMLVIVLQLTVVVERNLEFMSVMLVLALSILNMM